MSRSWPRWLTSSTAARCCCAVTSQGRGSTCRLRLTLLLQPLLHGLTSGSCPSDAALGCAFSASYPVKRRKKEENAMKQPGLTGQDQQAREANLLRKQKKSKDR